MVKSGGTEQYLGCTGSPADSHFVRWLTVSHDRPIERCSECGSVYKMEFIGQVDEHHHEGMLFRSYSHSHSSHPSVHSGLTFDTVSPFQIPTRKSPRRWLISSSPSTAICSRAPSFVVSFFLFFSVDEPSQHQASPSSSFFHHLLSSFFFCQISIFLSLRHLFCIS